MSQGRQTMLWIGDNLWAYVRPKDVNYMANELSEMWYYFVCILE